MIIYPAIDLIAGEIVRLHKGDFEQKTTYGTDPVSVARAYAEAGAAWLHLVDLDGAKDPANRQTGLIADIIEDEMAKGAFRGVLHCFSSGPDLARRAIDVGFYVSFSGILTFKSATTIQQVAIDSPEDRILVETDAPYLAPVPMRGKPNEPAYTSHTLAKLAEIRNTDAESMTAITRANTLRLFSRMGEG